MKRDFLILVQTMLTVVAIMFGIMTLFIEEFLIPFYIFLALTLMVLSYNNYKVFKRKYMTSIYLGFSFVVILNIILEVI